MYQRARTQVEGDGSLKILSWTELATTDVEAACAFYGKVFNWHKTDSMDMGEGRGIYQMVGNAGKSLGGIMQKNDGLPVPSWFFYFRVDDCKKRHDAATKAGAKTMYGPMEVPGGDIAAMMTDPQGAAFDRDAVDHRQPAPGSAAATPCLVHVRRVGRAASGRRSNRAKAPAGECRHRRRLLRVRRRERVLAQLFASARSLGLSAESRASQRRARGCGRSCRRARARCARPTSPSTDCAGRRPEA
jgi:predicted enzyme related to lactoylglutathione lyase